MYRSLLFVLLGLLLCSEMNFAQKGPKAIDNKLVIPFEAERPRILEAAKVMSADSIQKRIAYAERMLQLALGKNEIQEVVNGMLEIGSYYLLLEDYSAAEKSYSEALERARKNDLKTHMAVANNRLGFIYQFNLNYDLALEHYFQAIAIAHQSGNDEEIGYAYRHIGAISYLQNDLDKAHEYYLNALKFFQRAGKKNDVMAAYNNIGEIYRIRKEYDMARQYYNKALASAGDMLVSRSSSVTYQNLGNLELESGNPELAEVYLYKGLHISKEVGYHQGEANACIYLGRFFMVMKNYQKAQNYFKMALDQAVDINALWERRKATQGLSEALEALGDSDMALFYFKSYTELKDRMLNNEMLRQMKEVQSKYESVRYEKALVLKDQEIQTSLFKRQLSIAVAVIFLIVGISLYSRMRSNNRKNRELLEKNKQIHRAQGELMEVQLQNTELEKQRLENELKSKGQELSNFALHIVQKNDFLQELKKDIRDLKACCSYENAPQIKNLILKLNQNLQMSKDLEAFQQNVEQVNREFFDKLEERFPNLTENDRRLMALLRLNLTSKEIASINNISIKAVEMGRYRLRKKLELTNSDKLADFLQSL